MAVAVALKHGLYLIHIDPPYKHAAHYLGYSDDIARRVWEHVHVPSKASPLLKAALAAGCKLSVARVYLGAGRDFERRLKNRGSHKRHCPTCKRASGAQRG
jgi:predicted GIY-YIG superfamily endonuclease